MEKNSKALPNDKMICTDCKRTYTRSHRSQHRKTKICKAYQQANNAIREIIFEEPKKKILKDKLQKQYQDKDGNIVFMTDVQFQFHSKMPGQTFKLL